MVKLSKTDSSIQAKVNNILDVYNSAKPKTVEEGYCWYPTANHIAKGVGSLMADTWFTVYQVSSQLSEGERDRLLTILGAGILSAFSPQTDWDRNIQMAYQFAVTAERPSFCTNIVYLKAMSILKSSTELVRRDGGEFIYTASEQAKIVEDLLGKATAFKTKAFFNNINDPLGGFGATIDRHAISLYLGRIATEKELNSYFRSAKLYSDVQEAFATASWYADCHYNEMQAVTWLEWRKNKKDWV